MTGTNKQEHRRGVEIMIIKVTKTESTFIYKMTQIPFLKNKMFNLPWVFEKRVPKLSHKFSVNTKKFNF
jgi:hypothetical protein